MAGAEDPILPIFDRRAPLLERIRERRNKDNTVANNLGELVGRVVKTDSEVEIEQTRLDFLEGFRTSLAEELGVDETDVNGDFIEKMADEVVNVREQDVLDKDALEQLGIKENDEQEEQGEQNRTIFERGESEAEEEAGGSEGTEEEETDSEGELDFGG